MSGDPKRANRLGPVALYSAGGCTLMEGPTKAPNLCKPVRISQTICAESLLYP